MELNKKQLMEMGIRVTLEPLCVLNDLDIGGVWRTNGSIVDLEAYDTAVYRRLKIQDFKRKNKYAKEKSYPYVAWNNKGKVIQLPLGTLAYIWYYGSKPKNHVIVHLDGNPYNNVISNLVAMSRKEAAKYKYGSKKGVKRQWRS